MEPHHGLPPRLPLLLRRKAVPPFLWGYSDQLNKLSPQLRVDDGLYTLEKPFKSASGNVTPLPVGFEPTFHSYRLAMPSEKNLPANIFVGSMADIATQCRAHGIPVFMKRGTKTGREKDAAGFMEALMGAEFVREYPVQLTTPAWEHRPVHKIFVEAVRERKACRQCGASVQGKPAVRISGRFYICESCYKGALG